MLFSDSLKLLGEWRGEMAMRALTLISTELAVADFGATTAEGRSHYPSSSYRAAATSCGGAVRWDAKDGSDAGAAPNDRSFL